MAADAQDVAFRRAMDNTDVVLDCLFGAPFTSPLFSSIPRRVLADAAAPPAPPPAGFSFKPPARAPFVKVLDEFKKTAKPILSVDIPSGWDVDTGNADGSGFTPGACARSLRRSSLSRGHC